MAFVRREKKTVAWGNLGFIQTIIYKHYIIIHDYDYDY